ncbi:hypothetical protein ED312_09365 [Sinomicrobium pectinilyticum]|uniref:Uncharacterized protein n=1 Tax=Sinomicrobium pectinilyticum TaxID=1084421 RepID=A0A3N0EJI4_SINP1|nr:hypothetical protein [Sinomicrobium pectinilyticum]RNL87829.1 hypothetical protein ED312_09365 [Sinomicrobium pectinilyticum]
MKLVIRFFISLSVFLLSGYNLLHAHIDRDIASCIASVSDMESYEFAGFDAIQDKPDFVIRSASLDREQRGHETEERNIEEEYNELISFKKHPGSSNTNITALFYALIFGNFLYHARKRLFFSKQFFLFLSLTPLYIRFRVFRI